MAKDFFGSLGETLTKTAKELSGRAEEVYETQRLKNKISGEDHYRFIARRCICEQKTDAFRCMSGCMHHFQFEITQH